MDNNNRRQNIVIILTIIGILVSATGLVYLLVYNVPILTYEELDGYPLPNQSQIIPIVIRNEGHAKASDVIITIKINGNITNVQLTKQLLFQKITEDQIFEEITSIETRNLSSSSFCIVKAPRIIAEMQITIFLLIKTESNDPIDNIIITSDETKGRSHTKKDYLFLLHIMFFSIGVCCTLAIVYVYNIYKNKRKIDSEK